MSHSFIAKLTEGGGPPPLVELHRLVELAASSNDQTAWFATRKPGTGWTPTQDGTPSLALLFARTGIESVHAVVAEIRERRGQIPDDPAAQDLYRGHEGFRGWWLLANPIVVRLASLRSVPGNSAGGKSIADAFSGTLTFGYWSFDPNTPIVTLLGSMDQPVIELESVAQARPPVSASSAPVGPPEGATYQLGIGPQSDIYGVDFSGGQEAAARGNPKIWVASWDVKSGVIALRCGADEPPLRRADLPALVSSRPGWWILDFPFGVARETALALGIDGNNWGGWLDWCADGGDATERRDAARVSVESSGSIWSARRAVDREHSTTWFPLFEQLYKQTIYGAREVLNVLAAAPDVAILPWQDCEGARSVVVEGFPGVTIRSRLKMKGVGYKGRQAVHRQERERIVEALAGILPVPVPVDAASTAVNDTEGDALDALVLLLAGWVTQQHRGWEARRTSLTDELRLLEGWFPA